METADILLNKCRKVSTETSAGHGVERLAENSESEGQRRG